MPRTAEGPALPQTGRPNTLDHHARGGITMPSLRVRQTSAALVALVAAYVSYIHIVDVALAVGERREVAYALPVTIDALMVMSTLASGPVGGLPEGDDGSLCGLPDVAESGVWWFAVRTGPSGGLVRCADCALRDRSAVGWPTPSAYRVRSGRPTATQGRRQPPAPTGARPARQGGRRRRGDASAAVVAAMAAQPDASVAELARIAGVSRSTVRRTNGHQAVRP